jgi:hypothetical protein
MTEKNLDERNADVQEEDTDKDGSDLGVAGSLGHLASG